MPEKSEAESSKSCAFALVAKYRKLLTVSVGSAAALNAVPAAHTLLLEDTLRRLRLPVVLASYAKVAQEAAQQGLA